MRRKIGSEQEGKKETKNRHRTKGKCERGEKENKLRTREKNRTTS